ncbi:MAG: GspH/FimT family pseudopilin [Polaromonas sp.]|nr:GspH/FimT family pseudopilin [Polaromonas sp.]
MLNLRRSLEGGFSLIEVMVVVTIMGLLLVAGLPTIFDGVRDARVREAADSVVAGLRVAQSESLKRNSTFRFQMVTSLSDACAISNTGQAWVVSAGNATSKCHLSDPVADPFPMRKEGALLNTDIQLQAGTSGVVCFSGLGRPTTSPTGCNTVLAETIDVKPATAVCKADGGETRCLRVVVTTAGSVRMCDPAVTSAQDPRIC